MVDIQAILFDLDGTLVDSTSCVEAVWEEWAAKHDVDKDRLLTEVHGCRALEIIPMFKPELNVLDENDKLLKQEIEHASEVTLIPGADSLLHSLKNLPWGIVTMSSRELARAKLEATGLPMPDVLITADDITHGKPNPESYLLGAEKLKVEPSQCLVFEDAISGIKSANSAGMQVIQIVFSGHSDIQTDILSYIEDMTSVSVTVTDKKLTICV